MEGSVIRQIHRLRQMTVGELQLEWSKLYAGSTRSRNKEFLFRRLAWRVQELAHGGLSGRAKSRLEELTPDGFERARTPNVAAQAADVARSPNAICGRDSRLPTPGTIITKVYKGSELHVVIRDGGVEYEGQMFGSLTALAKRITGSKSINGKLFFGLTTRKRG